MSVAERADRATRRPEIRSVCTLDAAEGQQPGGQVLSHYQPIDPGTPLNGPVTQLVTQPP